MKNENKLIKEVLGEEFMQKMLSELGLHEVPADAQADLLAMIGQNIFKRVTLELLSALPESERDTFEQLIGGGDGVALLKFLQTHIPDLEQFIRDHAEREYEATKTQIVMERQGV